MSLPFIESALRKCPPSCLLISLLVATIPQNASAQESPFSLIILSDPQFFRAHNPRQESGERLCPKFDNNGVEILEEESVCLDLDLQCVSGVGALKLIDRSGVLCTPVAAADAVVDSIRNKIAKASPVKYWPEEIRCPGDHDGCISRGQANALLPPTGVIVNGDLTEDGALDGKLGGRSEWNAYEKLYEDALPLIWPGLGNHDYANEVEDDDRRHAVQWMADKMALLDAQESLVNYDLVGAVTVRNFSGARKAFAVNATGKRGWYELTGFGTRIVPLGQRNDEVRQPWKNISVQFFDRRLTFGGYVWKEIDRKSISNGFENRCFDLGPTGAHDSSPCDREEDIVRRGSLSYSFDIENYRFIQLQHYLGYAPGKYTARNKGGFDILGAEEWLTEELTQATALGKAIVINMHDHSRGSLKSIIADNEFNIVAVFAGHLHQNLGETPDDNWRTFNGRPVPVILSGGALLGTMLYVEFYDDYLNWAALRAWSTGNDTNHHDHPETQDRPATINRDSLFEYGVGKPEFVLDKRWSPWHTASSFNEKQGTIEFNFDSGGNENNTPPVALCTDVVAYADSSCTADASINNGSYDPDGEEISLNQSPSAPYGIGEHTVTLTALDGSGSSDSCEAIVLVSDVEKPRLACGGPTEITPADKLISIVATATDNCDVAKMSIDRYDCFRIGGAGQRVGLKHACEAELAGDTITIHRTVGVGSQITWSQMAEDGSGNVTKATCNVNVVKPGKRQGLGDQAQRGGNRK